MFLLNSGHKIILILLRALSRAITLNVKGSDDGIIKFLKLGMLTNTLVYEFIVNETLEGEDF